MGRFVRLKLGSRSSDLAKIQAHLVANALIKKHPNLEIEFNFRESLGDKNLNDPLWKMPEKGVFTADFYSDLCNEKLDFIVHSWKDLPIEDSEKSKIVATLPRADQRDILIVKKNSIENIKKTNTITIFTSSPRRSYNLSESLKSLLPWPDIECRFENIRGNVPTRLRKLFAGNNVDAIVLAKAGLDRFLENENDSKQFIKESLTQINWMILPLSINPNAAAQGAIAIEILNNRPELDKLFSAINCLETYSNVQQERKILASYGGGCHQKIGVSILKRDYGTWKIIKGKTDSQETLDELELENDCKLNNPIFDSAELNKWIKRSPLQYNISQNTQGLFISKAENINFNFNVFIWAAGIKTWKKLASQGLWCNGCAEGLGEYENKLTGSLISTDIVWTKLTHKENTQVSNCIATYELVELPGWSEALTQKIQNAESFYWRSSWHFKLITNHYPSVINKQHFCGPGNTHIALSKYLGYTPSICYLKDALN